jgi:hypothetical protein
MNTPRGILKAPFETTGATARSESRTNKHVAKRLEELFLSKHFPPGRKRLYADVFT